MKSAKPKVLQEVLFKPMIEWVTDAADKAGIQNICVVAGFGHEMLEQYLQGKYEIVLQQQRLGTAHAVMQAGDFFKRNSGGDVLILCGDAPFMSSETILNALREHRTKENAVTVITANAENPFGYGRVARDASGGVCRIVEEKDAAPEEKKIREINSGAYWFRVDALLQGLEKIDNRNAKGEYYLPSAVGVLHAMGLRAGAFQADMNVVAAANDREQLLELNEMARKSVLSRLMQNGVSVVNDSGILVGPGVEVGSDTVLLPGTILKGDTRIGSGCVIGPNSLVSDCTFGNDIVFNASQAYQSKIDDGATIGPFVHIRPHTVLHGKVHVGDFVEIKNSEIGEGTKVPHLTYVGDSDVGAHVNFGCGCVTVNYDGVSKHRTKVGDHAFIGCNTNLIAPVKIGDSAYTAAGSTITRDVPADALAVARTRQENKEGWVTRKRKRK